jgi:uncharacterized protein (DUF983 family)
MTTEETVLTPRSVPQAMLRGFKCRCPNCGEGRLFGKFLKVEPVCSVCGEHLDGHRADDLPPYITITIVAHIVIGLNLSIENASNWPLWWHMLLWPSLTVILTFLLMQRVKGATIGYQWALRMHGFDPLGDVHDVPMSAIARATSIGRK